MATAADATANTITNVSNWIKQPFNSSMSAGGWFLFLGLITAIGIAWGIILKDLKGEL